MTLWGFMHGIIQISQTKANMLASDGISTQQLIGHALKMAMLGMAPKGSGVGVGGGGGTCYRTDAKGCSLSAPTQPH
ncbi:MAG: hypothetical protein IPK27_11200 [Rhodanobacteraceae bacterium]|nr:hypothetical protein [Rhodanobacteraceae bacterium]